MLSHSPRIVSSGLVFCMDPMNQRCYSGGTTLQELSQSKATGVLVSGVTPSGGMFFFDGVDDHIQVDNTNNPYTFSNTTFTASVWVKSTFSGFGYMVAKDYGSANPGWALQTSTGVLVAALKGAGGSISAFRSTNTSFNDGQWHNFCAVITTNTTVAANNDVSLYLDGVLDQTSKSGSVAYSITSLPLMLGRRSTGNFYNGNIGLVTIYNRALSQQEITQNYLAHRSRYVNW